MSYESSNLKVLVDKLFEPVSPNLIFALVPPLPEISALRVTSPVKELILHASNHIE